MEALSPGPNDLIGGKPRLKYFNMKPFRGVGGRGGVVRLFFLAHNIEFDDEEVDFTE